MTAAHDKRTQGLAKQRIANRGAVLLVVLIVMVALLGLGMTGLFLTSSSVQMSANINLRNQALVVAEAGIERARGILNNRAAGWTPPVPALLAGSISSADEIPTKAADCDGTARGAIMIDPVASPCTASPLPASCILRGVSYPSISRSSDLPVSAGLSVRDAMGTYTVFIRQDQADCRVGNYTCDYSPQTVDAGSSGTGGSTAPVTCTVPANLPTPNGAVVIRSEGTASDGRTVVVLEVTMTPGQGSAQARNTPMSALCTAGAAGCDDNTSVQNGIVVNSPAPQTPPLGAGGTQSAGGAAGAGSGGATGTGGAVGGGGVTSPVTGSTGGSVGGATATTTTIGTGGVGTGGAGGTGGSSSCTPSVCPAIATMGPYGLNGSANFAVWLAAHSSNCVAQDLNIQDNVITDALLAPYRVILVLDVGHRREDYQAFWNMLATDPGNAWTVGWTNFSHGTIRQFSAAEGESVRRWVFGGGGLLITEGYDDGMWNLPNFNTIAEPLGLAYYSPTCGLSTTNCPDLLHANVAGSYNVTSFTPHAVTFGMTNLYLQGYWPITHYPPSAGFPTALAGGQLAWAYQSNKMVGVVTSYGNGRVVALADEWLTFDSVWTSAQYGSTDRAFWNNTVAWLGHCQ